MLGCWVEGCAGVLGGGVCWGAGWRGVLGCWVERCAGM